MQHPKTVQVRAVRCNVCCTYGVRMECYSTYCPSRARSGHPPRSSFRRRIVVFFPRDLPNQPPTVLRPRGQRLFGGFSDRLSSWRGSFGSPGSGRCVQARTFRLVDSAATKRLEAAHLSAPLSPRGHLRANCIQNKHGSGRKTRTFIVEPLTNFNRPVFARLFIWSRGHSTVRTSATNCAEFR